MSPWCSRHPQSVPDQTRRSAGSTTETQRTTENVSFAHAHITPLRCPVFPAWAQKAGFQRRREGPGGIPRVFHLTTPGGYRYARMEARRPGPTVPHCRGNSPVMGDATSMDGSGTIPDTTPR